MKNQPQAADTRRSTVAATRRLFFRRALAMIVLPALFATAAIVTEADVLDCQEGRAERSGAAVKRPEHDPIDWTHIDR